MSIEEDWLKSRKEEVPLMSPEKEDEDGLSPEERKIADSFLVEINANEKIASEKEKRDCNEEIIELYKLFAAFEAEHSIAELNSIINLTAENAPNHPIREPARKAFIPILDMLNVLKNETNIATEQYDELKNKSNYISKAVGIIIGDKIRH